METYRQPWMETVRAFILGQDPPTVVESSRAKADAEFAHVSLTVRKMVSRIVVSIEMLDDNWYPVPRYWTAEEWEAEVMRLRGARLLLDRQPLPQLKRAATLELRRAEAVTRFPHMTYEMRLRWYDLDDEGRPMEMP